METQGRVGAAPTTTGRAGTARRPGSGKQDGKVQGELNQWWNPRKRHSGPNLADLGRAATHARRREPTTGDSVVGVIPAFAERREEGLRRTRGEVAGEELGTAPVDRTMVNVGTIPGLPSPPANQAGGGQARRRLTTLGWGGVPVVVGGRESRPHGEGGQRVRSAGTGMPGGRR